jgi:hypothetical protein
LTRRARFTAHDTKYELLSPDTDTISVFERLTSFDQPSIDPHPISTAEVFDARVLSIDLDAGVSTRNQWIFDGDRTVRAPADHDLGTHKVEFLKQEPEPKTKHRHLAPRVGP